MAILVPRVFLRLPRFFIEGVSMTVELRVLNPDPKDSIDEISLELASRSKGVNARMEVKTIAPMGEIMGSMEIRPEELVSGQLTFDVTLRSQYCEMIRNRGNWYFPRLVRSRPVAPSSVNVMVDQRKQSGDEAKKFQGAAVSGGISGDQVHIHGARHETLDDLLRLADEATEFYELPSKPDAEIGIEPIRFENSVGMCLEPINAGSFIQGSSVKEQAEGRDDDERERGVSFNQPFWMGAHEVSQRAWCKIMGPMKSDHYLGDDMPAHSVTWDEANEFCQRLTAEEHQSRTLPRTLEYRLPTEAEWEYACRAGTREPRYGPIQDIAWVNQDSLQPLGRLLANKWNLYDMLGNCFEWCLDSYKSSYARQGNNFPDPFEHSPDPKVPKIIRGGCFQTGPQYARAAARTKVSADKRSGRISFRVVVAFVDRNPLRLHLAQTNSTR